MAKYIIGIDEVGRTARKKRASPNYIIGIDEVGRTARKKRASPNYIIGIDEVGRGSIAGPVTVAAVAVLLKFQNTSTKSQINSKFQILNSKLKLRDSKKLSPAQREKWFEYIKNHQNISYAVAHVQPSVVDKINISQAANRAASKALGKLLKNNELRIKNNVKIYLDGGLYIRDQLQTINYKPQTVIKGDEKIPAVALASIVAKVTRDRLMIRLHKKYPEYGFDIHKGYGTKIHMAAVKRFGPSEKHRLTFI